MTTAITVQVTPGKYTVPTAGTATFHWTAADTASGNHYVADGTEIVMVYNETSTARNVSITSQNDPWKRTGHVTNYSVGATKYCFFGPLPRDGWANSSGNILVTAGTDLKLAIIRPKAAA